MPAKPPHILPAGDAAEPDEAGAAEDDGTGGGNGPELTTPVGVSSGSELVIGAAVAVGAAIAAVAAVAAGGVSAFGLGGDEQLTSEVSNRNATHTRSRFGMPMAQH
jgi:hypothetical protein